MRGFHLSRCATALILSLFGLSVGCESTAHDDVVANGSAQSDRLAERDASAKPEGADARSSARTAQRETKNVISSAMAYPTGDRKTSALLVERTAPAHVRIGRPYMYDIKVTNLTKSPLQDVVVSEEVPENFRVTLADDRNGGPATRPAAEATAAAAPTQATAGAPNRYTIGELAPGESRTLRLSAFTDKPDRNFSSCVSVDYSPTLCTTTMVINPQVKLTLAAPALLDICDKDAAIQYTLTNSGIGTESDIHVVHQLPEGLRTAGGQNRIAFDVPSLREGETRSYSVKVAPQRTGELKYQAVAQTPGGEIKSEEIVSKVVAPRLSVELKGPEQDIAGAPIPYEITVRNTGDAPARNAIVSVDMAAARGSEFLGFAAPTQAGAGREPVLAAARGEGAAARDSRQSLGTIEPGQSRTVHANLRGTRAGAMQIAAIAEAACAERASAAAQTNIETIPALLMEVVDRADPIRVGENQLYTIRITNQGFGDDKQVRVVVTLPEGEEFVKAAGATEGAVEGNKITFAPVPVLRPKQTATWTVEVKAVKAGDVRFQVDLTSESLTKPATENEPTRLY